MSGLAETSPNTSRARVTHVRAIIDATALSVRIADNQCCAEFATHTGLVRVLLPADRFVSAARAERDGNGKPFPPTRADTRSEANLRVLEEDAAVVPLRSETRTQVRAPSAELDERSVLAWRLLIDDTTLAVDAACRQANVSRPYFYLWVRRHHPEEWQQRKRAGYEARSMGKDSNEALQRAWEMLKADPFLMVKDAAAAVGIAPSTLSQHLSAKCGPEWDALKIAHRRTRMETKREGRGVDRVGRPVLPIRQAQGKTGGPFLKPRGAIL